MHQGSDRLWRWDQTRVEFADGLSADEIEALATDLHIEVIQTKREVSTTTWDALNEQFFSRRPDVELRVYATDCDLSLATRMTNVRHFAADTIRRARNVQCIADLSNLESLSLGVFELEDFGVLEQVTPALTTLQVHDTRTRKASLVPLARFRSLRNVSIEGNSRNIEVLSELPLLEDITLRSVSTPNLEYLRPLEAIRSLDLKLGGIRSFSGIEGKTGIKYFEIWQIRQLADIGVVSTLPGLQNLFLQSLAHIAAIPRLRDSLALRRVSCMNMKGLRDFTELEWAPGLEEFALIEGLRQQPEQLVPVLRNPAVKRVLAGFGSDRRNEQFDLLREQYGKEQFREYAEYGFEYR